MISLQVFRSLLYSFVTYLIRFRMIYWFLCLYRRPLFWFNLRHKSKILHFSLSTNGWSACRFFDLCYILSLHISFDSEWSTDSYVCIVGLYFDLIFDINLKYFISLFRPMDDQLAGFSISLPFFRYISHSIQNDLLILMFVS